MGMSSGAVVGGEFVPANSVDRLHAHAPTASQQDANPSTKHAADRDTTSRNDGDGSGRGSSMGDSRYATMLLVSIGAWEILVAEINRISLSFRIRSIFHQ